MGHDKPTRPPRFKTREIADGVHAALGFNAATASNAGIVDLGDRTLVFDTFYTPAAGRALRDMAEELTGREVTLVVNSHAHFDHMNGNEVFGEDTTIIATCAARRWASTWLVGEVERSRTDPSALEGLIQDVQVTHDREADPHERAGMSEYLERLKMALEVLPALSFTLPNMSFDGALEIHGEKRSAALVAYRDGHTDGDCVLVLPGDGIVFMGDLGFCRVHPLVTSHSTRGWRAALKGIIDSTTETFVPGHGPIATRREVALSRQYLKELETLARQIQARGGTATEASVPSDFEGWSGGRWGFHRNLQNMLRHRIDAD